MSHLPKRSKVECHAHAKQALREKLIEHKQYIAQYGDDMPEIVTWSWNGKLSATGGASTEADNV